MTIKEMSEAICEHCHSNNDCLECELHPLPSTGICFSYKEGDETQEGIIRRNYEFLFGKTEAEPAEHDSVNHPSHYCQEGSMECIDEMLAVFGTDAVKAFCLCNVWKYRKRAVFKNGEEDLKKSDWYLKKYLELGGKCDLV